MSWFNDLDLQVRDSLRDDFYDTWLCLETAAPLAANTIFVCGETGKYSPYVKGTTGKLAVLTYPIAATNIREIRARVLRKGKVVGSRLVIHGGAKVDGAVRDQLRKNGLVPV